MSPQPSEIRSTSSQVMELQQLIAAPLVAAVDADSLAARRYLDYLFEIAFENYDYRTRKAGKLRMLTFGYDTCEAGENRRQTVSIPMLTLVPLPLLQIKEADFDFDINIIDAVSRQTQTRFSLATGQAVTSDDDPDTDLRMRATLAPQQGGISDRRSRQSLAANMKIHVRMAQSDMPGGLSNLLHLTTNQALQSQSEERHETVKPETDHEPIEQ